MLIDNNIIDIIINEEDKNKFYDDINKIYKYSKKNDIYLGIDFEFNTKKIALMQLLFEIRIDKSDKILKKYYIIYPPNLNEKTLTFLKMNIFANKKILKILHGAESLDIPYIVQDFFNYDTIPIIDFFLSMIDTRYLCEYLNLILNKSKICSIYDMLLNFNIINENIKNKLDENENKMGPIYNIFIDINNLSKELITYSIYDVVYLIKAYEILKMNIIKHNPKNYYLLVDSIRYCYMEKINITNVGDNLVILNKMNNYFIYIKIFNNKNEKINLIKIFTIILDKYKDTYPEINFILNINYLKINILNLLKTIIYVIVENNYKIHASNIELNKYSLIEDYKLIIEYLKFLNLNYLLDLIELFYEFSNNILSS